MFGTEDEYERAVRGASIHAYETEGSFGTTMKSLVVVGLLSSAAYFAFNYYNSAVASTNQTAVLAQVSETLPSVVMSATHTREVEDDYLIALNNMEVDILGEEKNENVKLDTSAQESLSEAMSSIIDDSSVLDSSNYTKELIKEIKDDVVNDAPSKVEKSRVVIVKKGDTLASLSAKFYGDSMKYDKIIASNGGIIATDGKIYAGETINLPY